MNQTLIKATLMVAFLVLTAGLTFIGLNKKEATIDFDALTKEKTSDISKQNEEDFSKLLKNIGSSTTLIKPDILVSTDTGRLSLAIELLDSNRQFTYAAVLSEKLATIQNSEKRFHEAARYYLSETYSHDADKNEIMYIKKARTLLDKCISLNPANLDAKVDLAVCLYNIYRIEPPENKMDNMKPAKLLLNVVETDENHEDALYYLGKLSIETGQYEKAIERFKKLVSLQPQNSEFYMELSKIYQLQGNTEEARKWSEMANNLKK